ncbi:MAG: TolC family protein [Saprospirales bacterium]|nr:MAG: TolC family protein [Saprospirales bacterium]
MNYKKLFFLIPAIAILSTTSAIAQEVWTLEECVRHAVENNIEIRNILVNEELNKINTLQARHDRYPSLTANSNLGNNFGRTIDPSTNQFRSQNLTFNSWSFNVSVPVFNGFAITNSIKQAELQQQASAYETKQVLDDIQLTVVTFYLNVLFAEDNLSNARNQLEISTRQMERMQRLIDAGAMSRGEIFDLQVQVALDEERMVMAENAVNQAMIQLKNLLVLDPDKEMVLDRPELEVPEADPLLTIDFQSLYNRALETQASVKSSELQIQAAEKGEKIAASAMMPSLFLGGSLSTNYSSRAQEIAGFQTVLEEVPATINGETAIIGFPNVVPNLRDQAYFDQLEANFGYGVGLTLSIPIYNNYRNRHNVQRAKLNTIRTQNQDELLRQRLRTNISQAQADARAASKSYQAAQRAVDASEMALRNAERKLDAGTATAFELVNAQNVLNNSRNNVLQSKYDYIFKLKVIDYYLGNPITLD